MRLFSKHRKSNKFNWPCVCPYYTICINLILISFVKWHLWLTRLCTMWKHPVKLSTKAFLVSSENLFLCVLSALYVIMFLKSIRIKTLYITMVSISLIHHYSITEWNKYKGTHLGAWKKVYIYYRLRNETSRTDAKETSDKLLNNWTEVRLSSLITFFCMFSGRASPFDMHGHNSKQQPNESDSYKHSANLSNSIYQQNTMSN